MSFFDFKNFNFGFFKNNFFKSIFLYSALSILSFNVYAKSNVDYKNFLGFDEGKKIILEVVKENLEPVYNPCVPSRSVPPNNYSDLVKKVLYYTADKIGNNNGFVEDEEVSIVLQYTLMSWKDLNRLYCPKGGPPFENTYNFKIVKELFNEYKSSGPNILPFSLKLYLKFKHGI